VAAPFASQERSIHATRKFERIIAFVTSTAKGESLMKVGIIGSGDVAQALGEGFLACGYETMLGTREISKLTEWQRSNPKGQVASVDETAGFADVIVLAVKGSASAQALRSASDKNLAGKIVIDATNPTTDEPPDHGVLKFFTGPNESLMEALQKDFPNTHFVKAFNAVGYRLFFRPQFDAGKPTMFICGNDEDAKATVTKILDQFGWETADMGTVEAARAIEPLCMLWCIPGFLHNQWDHAFKLLRK
jgi:predicted dinucleotide-binding enzyme